MHAHVAAQLACACVAMLLVSTAAAAATATVTATPTATATAIATAASASAAAAAAETAAAAAAAQSSCRAGTGIERLRGLHPSCHRRQADVDWWRNQACTLSTRPPPSVPSSTSGHSARPLPHCSPPDPFHCSASCVTCPAPLLLPHPSFPDPPSIR
eukprot:361052-Chlamydomonas_euryale.AAC.2